MKDQASTLILPKAKVIADALPSSITPPVYGLISIVLLGIVAMLSPNFGVAAIAAGIAAFIVAAGAIVFLVLDKTGANRTKWALAAGMLVVLAFIGLGGSGGAYQFTIARAEAQGNYGMAISALQATGQKAPYSTALAQAYLDWGRAEISQHAYAAAVTHLTYLAQSFPTLPQAATALALLPGVHLSWAQYATQQNDPVTAGEQYQILLTRFASSPEAAQAHSAMPGAFLKWGDAEQQAGYYDVAYTAYQLIAQNFPQSAEAPQAHQHAAADLLAWADALTKAHLYGDASIHFTDLAKNYGDTPQGQTAQALLAKGVTVIGRLVRADGKTPVVPYTTVRLSSAWTVSSGTYTAGGQQYYADTDAHGYFEFPSVPPGQYLLEWRSLDSGAFLTLFNGTTPLEIITIRPLESPILPVITTDQK
jgi:tetratricopeptide (TPR) repeat protein